MPKSNKKINTKIKSVYLDHASATPVDDEVLRIVTKIAKDNFANAGAIHELGVRSKKILEDARGEVARVLGGHADEIIFTSGATEANNLAILGVVNSSKMNPPHIVTTNIEHASVLEVCKYLENPPAGGKIAEVSFVPVEANGIVSPEKIKKALRPNTVLVSVMYANNEIGTIQPIREIAKILRHYKKNNPKSTILFHTDSVQAVNYLDINVLRLGVDLMTINGGKIYGPKGVGALYVKRGVKPEKILHGGEQESGLRSGTENLSAIAGLAEALRISEKIKEKEEKRLIILRDYFLNKLMTSEVIKNTGVTVNGDATQRLPNNVNITIPRIPSDLLVIELSARGIYVSEKSACKSGDKSASHVISAIRSIQGSPLDEGSLRFSLGRSTTKQDIDYTLRALEQIFTKLNKWYN